MNETNGSVTKSRAARPLRQRLSFFRPKPTSPRIVALPQSQTAPKREVPRKVRFELDGVASSSAFVAGSFNNWDPGTTPLVCLGDGKWATELPLAPGRYEYRFVVDGKWVDDPKAKAFVPNPHNGRNAVIEVG